MGHRRKSGFELDVFDQRPSPRRRLDEFLAIYVSYFTPQHRTDTNQLIHYMQHPLPGRRIIYFGLRYEGLPTGFCVLMYYPKQAIGVFDFMVLAPNRRGHGAFFEFTNLIAEYLESQRIVPNYLVAEVVRSQGQLTHGVTASLLVRLLRFQRFRTAKLPYKAPDPAIVSDPSSCEAFLMLALEPDQSEISASELIRIVELIYLNHYLLWFKGVMAPAEGRAYEQAVRTECTNLCQAARSHEVIVLDGMRDLEVALEYPSERRDLTLAVAGVTTAVVSTAVALKDQPKVALPLLGVGLMALLVGLRRSRLRRALLGVFGR